MKIKPRIIGVIGSSASSQAGLDLAFQVGQGIANAGAVLVTGGLGGVMESASRGCAEAGGLVLGILPSVDSDTANPYVDITIPSGMGHARNILVAQTAQALIAIEGSLGTLSEIAIGLKIGRAVFLLGSELRVEGAVPVETAHMAVNAALRALEEGSNDR
ncbi:TIGR00725 family protein [Geopsychrobacter electrodiphilus]|uniref:TIGR00725 family protein n=1 Tax=Geopsychrobacter electrodiphilus TaxID=225196 RepID=UPI00036C156E|nr:TIGR00725 family protein [Geopsychrobacter electrodiphilus]